MNSQQSRVEVKVGLGFLVSGLGLGFSVSGLNSTPLSLRVLVLFSRRFWV